MPLIYDSRNPRAVMVHAFLQEYMQLSRIDPNMYVVIGGDGFMLRSVREHDVPGAMFLGLNCGRLGFLLNEIPSELERLPELICSDRLKVLSFPRIGMEARDVHGDIHRARALNDIYLERMTGQTCQLMIQIDGTVVVHEIVCDGLIMCTALGTTAYSFSAGGTVCHPTLEVIGVTPICPHMPRLTPLLFPLASTVVVEVLVHERRRVRAVVDGVDYNEIATITVSDARSPVQLAFFSDHDFTGTLVGKLLNT